MTAPGDIGRRAQAIAVIAAHAAKDTGRHADEVVSPDGMLRLLDKRPDSAGNVSATPGVSLTGNRATAVVEVLKK